MALSVLLACDRNTAFTSIIRAEDKSDIKCLELCHTEKILSLNKNCLQTPEIIDMFSEVVMTYLP